MLSSRLQAALVGILLLSGDVALAATAKLLFTDDAPLKAVLTAPLTQVYEQKELEQRIYMDGKWSYKLEDETVMRLDVKIRSRGNFRRENCELPPLRLNFRQKALAGTLYEGQNKLKMVGPCGRRDKYQQYVAVEYLTYKLFELLSEYHFKVRLVELGHVDTDAKLTAWNSTNFVIEDLKDMAARYGMKQVKEEKPAREQLDLGHTAFVELFQLMIGNNDYSTLRSLPGNRCCHNSGLIGRKGSESGYIPVPYDFDASGMVNASYANPPAHLPINKVSQRYFTGWCKQEHHYQNAVARFNEHREEVLALFSDSSLLEKRYKKRSLSYIEDFYELINDKRELKKKVIDRCRGEVITDPQG